MTINVTSVTDPPAGTDTTVTLHEVITHTSSTHQFGHSFPTRRSSDLLAAVKITTVPGTGTLKNDSTVLANGDVVLAADIAANKIVFIQVGNADGSAYRISTFQ